MNLLRIYRILSNLTQIQLSEMTGMDQSIISKIEKGAIKASHDQKSRICSTLKLNHKLIFPNEDKTS